MIPSFLLALREGVEAALVIGILLGALRKLGRSNLSGSVWLGAVSAAVVSIAAALGLRLAGAELEGTAEQVFEGVMLLVAAALLTWMIFWMHHQARFLKSKIEKDVRQAVNQDGGRKALFGIAFFAVVREGIELAIFLVAAGLTSNPLQSLFGALTGIAAAAFLGWALFYTTRRLSLRYFFQITNVLLILFAAGLIGHGIHEFNEAGLIPPVVEHVYNLAPVIDEDGPLGLILSALFGYNANPSLTEVIAYVSYFVVLVFALVRFQYEAAVQTVEH